tara:strand:+ start:196 stop:345 length:150 start_codon:yes stop_codon:yes gene_type:complete
MFKGNNSMASSILEQRRKSFSYLINMPARTLVSTSFIFPGNNPLKPLFL